MAGSNDRIIENYNHFERNTSMLYVCRLYFRENYYLHEQNKKMQDNNIKNNRNSIMSNCGY